MAPPARGGATNPRSSPATNWPISSRSASGTTGTEQASYREAAAVLDRERHDLITAAGRQFRIVRAGHVARTGPDGPEPPRAADSTRPHRPDPGQMFLEDADADRDIASATLKTALRAWQSKAGTRPQNSSPMNAGPALPSPLTSGRLHPRGKNPARKPCAACAQAADDLESAQFNEITAAGRRFRVSRVERYVRTRPCWPRATPALRPRLLPSPRGLDHRHRQQLTHSPNDPSRTG